MRLCFVEDGAVEALKPLSLTRPVYELLLGSRSLGQKAARAFGIDWNSTRRGALVRPHLVKPQRATNPRTAINDHAWLTRGPVLVVNSRWVPPADFTMPTVRRSMVGLCDGQVACAWVGPGQAMGLELQHVDRWFEEMASRLEALDIGGEWINRPWDLIDKNAGHLTRDFAASKMLEFGDRNLVQGTLVGPANRLYVHPTARVEPDTVFDTTGGTIAMEAGVVISSRTRIEGPCSIGENSRLIRATIRGGVTVGPNCRIGGEIEQSIVHGYTNKHDDAFLSHAYVGEWVNLGAIPPQSDFHDDNSVPLTGERLARKRPKLGFFLGDHSHTHLGDRLDAGTEIGVMCHVLTTGLPMPDQVPSFSAVGHSGIAAEFSLEKLFASARDSMERRGREFTEVHQQLFLDLYEQTRREREQFFRDPVEPRHESRRVAEVRG